MKHFSHLSFLLFLPLFLLGLPMDGLANCTGEIVKIKLRNMEGDKSIKLVDGRTYNTGDIPALSKIRVFVTGQHESAIIRVTGDMFEEHTDNKAPYTYNSGDGIAFTPGAYTIRVRLFSQNNGQGQMCDVKNINFFVEDGPSSAEIKRVKLYNMDGDNNIKLEDGKSFSLGELPNRFKIAAGVSGFHESMQFLLSGPINAQHTDNKAPYVFKGNNGFNFIPGDYTLIAQLYTGNNLGGEMVEELRLNFTIEDGPSSAEIKKIKLQALGGGSNLNLEDGETYSLAQIPPLCRIKAITGGFHESLKFSVSGPVEGQFIDNKLPYICSGQQGLELQPGDYTIETELFSANHSGGELCDHKTISFTITDNYCTGQIRKFRFKGFGGQPSMDIVDGAVYQRNELPEVFKIQANVAGEAESVEFTLSGEMYADHLDNSKPYRLNGGENLQEWPAGTYTVNAKAYSYDNANGDFCDEKTVTFTIEVPEIVNVEAGAIAPGHCDLKGNLVLDNEVSPDSEGEDIEVVWIMSDGSLDCEAAAIELEDVNVGELYNAFITAGGFGSINPGVGNTSWAFLPEDNDGSDLSLRILGVEGTACYIRMVRVEGTQEFTGKTDPLFIQGGDCPNCDEPIDGGLIVGEDQDPSSGFVVIENDRAPANPGNGIDTPETIFIKSTTSASATTSQLATINVGEEFDLFLDDGGFDTADPRIEGTSLKFMDDGDEDHLSLVDDEVLEQACYIRCVRAPGCPEFHGDSNPVTINLGGGGALVESDDDDEAEETRVGVSDGSEDELEERTDSVLEEGILQELQHTDDALSVFPNPAHGMVFFATEKFATTGGVLEIYNGLGQLLYQQNFSAGRNTTFQFDLERFSLGLYFVRLEFEDGEKLINRFVVD